MEISDGRGERARNVQMLDGAQGKRRSRGKVKQVVFKCDVGLFGCLVMGRGIAVDINGAGWKTWQSATSNWGYVLSVLFYVGKFFQLYFMILIVFQCYRTNYLYFKCRLKYCRSQNVWMQYKHKHELEEQESYHGCDKLSIFEGKSLVLSFFYVTSWIYYQNKSEQV